VGDAVWLLLALPPWFFANLGDPTGAGLLTAVPAAGALSLFIGFLLAVRRPSRRLLAFLLPFGGSEALVAAAGFGRGDVPDPTAILLAFLGVQLALSIGLVIFARGSLRAALALAIFSIGYAAFAAFVAAMAFPDRWV